MAKGCSTSTCWGRARTRLWLDFPKTNANRIREVFEDISFTDRALTRLPFRPHRKLPETQLNMASTQAIYTSLSIISLTALVGMGVAVGSGVSMMAMAMDEEEQKAKMVASSVVEQSFRPAARGFAASGAK